MITFLVGTITFILGLGIGHLVRIDQEKENLSRIAHSHRMIEIDDHMYVLAKTSVTSEQIDSAASTEIVDDGPEDPDAWSKRTEHRSLQ